MQDSCDFELRVKSALVSTTGEFDRRVLADAAKLFASRPASSQRNQGGYKMSRILTLAALVLVTVVTLSLLNKSSSIAFAAVQEQVANINFVKFRFRALEAGMTFEVYATSDGRIRYDMKDGESTLNSVIILPSGPIAVKEYGAKHVRMIPREGQVLELAEGLGAFFSNFADLNEDRTEQRAPRDIEGKQLIGFRVMREHSEAISSTAMTHWTVWADRTTKLPVLIECSSSWEAPPTTIMDQFDFKPAFDEGTFDQSPAAGWEVTTEGILEVHRRDD